jgi:hypothetical protein
VPPLPLAGAAGGAAAGAQDEASAEIADIDSRLHALQHFLRMAKSTTLAQ